MIIVIYEEKARVTQSAAAVQCPPIGRRENENN